MSWVVSKKKEFIGKRSFQLPYLKAAGRQQLVGLLSENNDEVIPEGAYITVLNAQPDEHGKTRHIGYVTSSYYSPTLGRAFALALVADGLNRMGEVVAVPMTDPMNLGKKSDACHYLRQLYSLTRKTSEEIN